MILTSEQLGSPDLLARFQEQDPRNVATRGRPRAENPASQPPQNAQEVRPNRPDDASTRRTLSHDEAPARGARGGRTARGGNIARRRTNDQGGVQRPAPRGDRAHRSRGGGTGRGATAQLARRVDDMQGNMVEMQGHMSGMQDMIRQILQNQQRQQDGQN